MHQPWASLLVYGVKRGEGRVWTTTFSGKLWIHATKHTPDPEEVRALEERYRALFALSGLDVTQCLPKTYPTSCVLGRVDISGVTTGEENARRIAAGELPPHFESPMPYVFVADGKCERLILPPRVPGRPKLWSLDGKLARGLEAQLRVSPAPGVLSRARSAPAVAPSPHGGDRYDNDGDLQRALALSMSTLMQDSSCPVDAAAPAPGLAPLASVGLDAPPPPGLAAPAPPLRGDGGRRGAARRTPNFFVSLRTTSGSVAAGFERVHSALRAQSDARLAKACVDARLAHITLCVLELGDASAIAEAVGALGRLSETAAARDGALRLRIAGVDTFGARVLYAIPAPEDAAARRRLGALSDAAQRSFGLLVVAPRKSAVFTPHVTVAKLSRRTGTLQKIPRSAWAAVAAVSFGSVDIVEIALCRMGGEKAADGHYFEVASVPLYS
jgi:2'-5' RNA ligase